MSELLMEKLLLYPQSSLKSNYNYWESLHKRLQYLLDIHKEQGNKIDIFPFDLSYLITNKWNKDEQNSYKVYCNLDDFETKENLKIMIDENVEKIKKTREKIHDRLQYLLNLHVDVIKPFPLDLVYLLDLETDYVFESKNYDSEYNYNRMYPQPYYKNPIFYFERQNEFNNSFDQYSFYDLEDKELNINNLKYYIKAGLITASVPEDYILWKSARNDNMYKYNRSYSKSYYDPDNYLPEDDVSEISEYEYNELNNDYEPDYKSFNHFKDIETYDDFYDNVEV